MFMRYLDDGHPALKRSPDHERWRSVIQETYVRMDRMVGRVLEEVDVADPRTLLMVISDHGFKTFRRGVNLNSWLAKHGYLALLPGREESGEWLEGVDWSRTRAFAMGLGGIFLNVRGREAQGIVPAGEAAKRLADELAKRLTGLVDPEIGDVGIERCYASHRIYDGPYAEDAPDLIVGYAEGWRHSWDGARGIVSSVIFEDNEKAWSGDHCIDPELVPGVILSNRKLSRSDPSIADLAPTLLELFGVPAPGYMDGRSLA
jgi:predicted AlkP superfamily phosphohydrolase/phosphomutase